MKALKYNTCAMYIDHVYLYYQYKPSLVHKTVCTACTRTNNEALYETRKLVWCQLLQRQSYSLHKFASADPTVHELHTRSAKNMLYNVSIGACHLTFTLSQTLGRDIDKVQIRRFNSINCLVYFTIYA
jgi:hypothetical protein